MDNIFNEFNVAVHTVLLYLDLMFLQIRTKLKESFKNVLIAVNYK